MTTLVLIVSLVVGGALLVLLARGERFVFRMATPVVFGLLVLWLWQVACTGYGVPLVLLPAPSQICAGILSHLPTLAADFRQTFLRAVIPGWAIGSAAGLLVAIALDASPFLRRGDLMRSYGAGYLQTLLKLRLPSALPFVFNALKLNATLALIGAIVAEFFGTPIVGMGFRISTEAARLNLDVVWAEIVMAAVAGSISFALLALVERIVTFWHPSFH
ncbi:MAG: ABC transporter permease subunit [Acetobacteraceae bacterium]